MHHYFEALGVDEIRRMSRAEDKPLRMVKTALHELCKIIGTDILNFCHVLPQVRAPCEPAYTGHELIAAHYLSG